MPARQTLQDRTHGDKSNSQTYLCGKVALQATLCPVRPLGMQPLDVCQLCLDAGVEKPLTTAP